MNTVNMLKSKIVSLELKHSKEVDTIKDMLQEKLNTKFKRNKLLTVAIKELEHSKEFGSDEAGIYSWVRFNGLSDIPENEREYLEVYLGDLCIHVDFKNDALLMYAGPSWIVTDEGRVFDEESNKTIIERNEYESRAELYRLIEAHMEKTGYFPGVFRVDHYGNVFPVNTLKNEEE